MSFWSATSPTSDDHEIPRGLSKFLKVSSSLSPPPVAATAGASGPLSKIMEKPRPDCSISTLLSPIMGNNRARAYNLSIPRFHSYPRGGSLANQSPRATEDFFTFLVAFFAAFFTFGFSFSGLCGVFIALLSYRRLPSCRSHSIGNCLSRSSSSRLAGCRPSRIASIRVGESRVRRRTRPR